LLLFLAAAARGDCVQRGALLCWTAPAFCGARRLRAARVLVLELRRRDGAAREMRWAF